MSNFVSFSDLRKSRDEDSREDRNSSSDRYNELYTGGGKSGLAVIGGGGGGGEISAEERNGKILRRVKRTKTNERDDQGKGASSETTDSIGGVKRPSIIITLYKNGFVVGDGPFRSNEEEKNKRFLNDLAKGECPAELETEDHKHGLVQVKDKHDIEYVTPSYVAFEGQGHSLAAGAAERASDVEFGDGTARKIVLEDEKKTVQIQVMLHDRRREVVTCNLTTTVRELFQHVAALTPSLGSAFSLLQGYPPKPIGKEAMDATVVDAGLGGSRVMQRKK